MGIIFGLFCFLMGHNLEWFIHNVQIRLDVNYLVDVTQEKTHLKYWYIS